MGAGRTGKGGRSSAGAPKFPVLVWQSWDAELQADMGKGPPAHCLPRILCGWGPQGCSA